MAQEPIYSSQPVYENPEPEKKNNTVKIIIIVAAVLLVCCCLTLVAGWFLGDPILDFLRGMGLDMDLALPLMW